MMPDPGARIAGMAVEWGWAGWDGDDPERGMPLADEEAARQVVAEHRAAGQDVVLVRRHVGPWVAVDQEETPDADA